ncbi:MAG: DegT/DnrJ/EryC1/StrS family aminotransferase, partial [Bacteroidales bacterium]
MKEKIWLSLASMGGKEQDFINEAFITNWVVPLGPNVNGFEADLESYLHADSGICSAADSEIRGSVQQTECECADSEIRGFGDSQQNASAHLRITKKTTPHVVALSAGTAALHLALIQLGVGSDDEVICQSFTFAASANPIVYQGAQPVYVDSEKETWNMCPVALEEAIKDRIAKTGKAPKAIIPVHLYGMPAKMDAICSIADKYGIPVVEDAAEALGSSLSQRSCGTFGE